LIVLLSCTVLYAIIAEILVDAVDVVLDGSGLDIKLLGVTLFALVPNATEFMNAMSFAINGNIALSMEIGSAYALQVCLIQIPAMVAFSAWYNSNREADIHNTFTLIFPRWDVIAIIFAIFLLTYTYIEARSNYFRGSLLILSYVVLVSGFVFAPSTGDTESPGDDNQGGGGGGSGGGGTGHPSTWMLSNGGAFGAAPVSSSTGATTSFGGLRESMADHPAMVGYAWVEALFVSLWYR
jgi:Ca2+:H+ antiporter